MHPFVGAMVGFLSESGNRVQRPAIVTKFKKAANTKYKEDSDYMYKISKELVKHRRDYPTEKKDLLNAMISGTDPHSGSTMRDDLIIANIITFLIAGKMSSNLNVSLPLTHYSRPRNNVWTALFCLSKSPSKSISIL